MIYGFITVISPISPRGDKTKFRSHLGEKYLEIVSDSPGSHRAPRKIELKLTTAKHTTHSNKASLSAPPLFSSHHAQNRAIAPGFCFQEIKSFHNWLVSKKQQPPLTLRCKEPKIVKGSEGLEDLISFTCKVTGWSCLLSSSRKAVIRLRALQTWTNWSVPTRQSSLLSSPFHKTQKVGRNLFTPPPLGTGFFIPLFGSLYINSRYQRWGLLC